MIWYNENMIQFNSIQFNQIELLKTNIFRIHMAIICIFHMYDDTFHNFLKY